MRITRGEKAKRSEEIVRSVKVDLTWEQEEDRVSANSPEANKRKKEKREETTDREPEDIESVCKKERASERWLSGSTLGKAREGERERERERDLDMYSGRFSRL